MKKISTYLILTLAATVLAGTANAQYNSNYCGNHTTVGTYVVSCAGFVTPAPNSPALPMTVLAVVVGDSSGVFKGTGTNSVAGTVYSDSISGQANTQPDCTGTITYNKGKADEINITFVIAANGDRIHGMIIDKGANVGCTLTRIRP